MSAVLKNLKTLRVSRNMTQKDLAKKIGYTQQTYGKKEKGDIPITLNELETLADFYGVSLKDIFDGTDKSTEHKHDGRGECGKEAISNDNELTRVVVRLNRLLDEKERLLEEKDLKIRLLETTRRGGVTSLPTQMRRMLVRATTAASGSG